MSFYATIEGEVTFQDKTRLDEVVQSLTEDKWMKDGKFIDECETVVDESTESDIDGLTLRIPLCHYRNLSRRLDWMVQGCKDAHIVWTSTDGCFDGGVYEGDRETCFDLAKWAKETLEPEDQNPPDMEKDFDAYCEWQQMVEQEFFSDNS